MLSKLNQTGDIRDQRIIVYDSPKLFIPLTFYSLVLNFYILILYLLSISMLSCYHGEATVPL